MEHATRNIRKGGIVGRSSRGCSGRAVETSLSEVLLEAVECLEVLVRDTYGAELGRCGVLEVVGVWRGRRMPSAQEGRQRHDNVRGRREVRTRRRGKRGARLLVVTCVSRRQVRSLIRS